MAHLSPEVALMEPAVVEHSVAPVSVHVVFHPSSTSSLAAASAIGTALGGDGTTIGQPVPVFRLRPVDATMPPEEGLVFTGSPVELVVVLADDHMVAHKWGPFIADLYQQCRARGARFLPLQMTNNAFPLHESLALTRFQRMFDAQGNVAQAAVERAVVSELCRLVIAYDNGEAADLSAPPPIRLFLSHAKQDIDVVPHVLKEITSHLDETQPVQVWVDSAKIDVGRDFSLAIEDGIRSCAVLVIATPSYSSRAWCRREVLLAKKHRRPVVVIRAAAGAEYRSFPYAGNVPVLAWMEGAASRAVDLMLSETLRVAHARLLLKPLAHDGEEVLPNPPELVTVNELAEGSSVLYPDPPLGDEEAQLFRPRKIALRTPLQSLTHAGRLSGAKIALSISESDTLPAGGVFAEQMDPTFVELSRHLLALGATLAYGGHLGSAGYTQTLFELVRAHNGAGIFERAHAIVNYVGWPLPHTQLHVSSLAAIWDVAQLVRVERPAELADFVPPFETEPATALDCDSADNRFAWARGMTAMRERMTSETDARIAVGGRATGAYGGRMPGVIEEAWHSMRQRKPLYVCGVFGGAAHSVALLLKGQVPSSFSWPSQKSVPHSEGMRKLYETRGIAFDDYPAMAAEFAAFGVEGLSKFNGLTPDENRELFLARDVTRIVSLIVNGLSKVLP